MLDAGCGEGYRARILASRGAQVAIVSDRDQGDHVVIQRNSVAILTELRRHKDAQGLGHAIGQASGGIFGHEGGNRGCGGRICGATLFWGNSDERARCAPPGRGGDRSRLG